MFSFSPPSATFCSCFLFLLPSTQCQTPRVIGQHRGDGEHDDQGFASHHGALQASRHWHDLPRLYCRRGKHKCLCFKSLLEGLRASSVSVVRSCRRLNASLFQTGPELLPRVNMLLLLQSVISTATPRLQVSPSV